MKYIHRLLNGVTGKDATLDLGQTALQHSAGLQMSHCTAQSKYQQANEQAAEAQNSWHAMQGKAWLLPGGSLIYKQIHQTSAL
jgi:hypothetical protein